MQSTQDLIIIGSPRGKGSNSWFLAQIFIKGHNKHKSWSPEVIFLNQKKALDAQLEAFKNAQRIFLFFPLYTDAMPAIVKCFMENLTADDFKGKKMGLFIISGFPEAYHSIFVEKYFLKLTKKYDAQCVGSAIKGGMENVMEQPRWMSRSTRKDVALLGAAIAQKGHFDSKITAKLRMMMHLSPVVVFMLRLMKRLNLTDRYWNKNLKKNEALERRYDQPYAK